MEPPPPEYQRWVLPLPAPVLPRWSSARIFGNAQPWEIDAGSGKGRFLLARAAKNADTNFLGIERQTYRVQKVARKAYQAGLENIRIVKAEIAFTLENLIPDNSIRTLYLFYPDPWPKRRHHHRRLLQPAFLDLIARKLQSGGKLHFATDETGYAQHAATLLQSHAILTPCEPFLPAPEEKTDFELLFEKQGLHANRVSVLKP